MKNSSAIHLMMVGLAALFMVVACGKKKKSSGSATNLNYGLSNGICLDNAGNPVALSNCGVAASTLFSAATGQCVRLADSMAVNAIYCSSNPFLYNGTTCFDTANANAVVSANHCTITNFSGGTIPVNPNGRYVLNNGHCFDSQTNQFVSSHFCGIQAAANQCFGPHEIVSAGYTVGYINCNGQNCSGYTLTNSATRQRVTCQ